MSVSGLTLRREHGALAFLDIRTSQENDLYILLSGNAILAIENIPTPKKGYIRELRVIESLDDENKADMEAFLGLEVASWFVPGKTSPHLQTNSRPKFDKQEKAVLTLTAISAFTGLHVSLPFFVVSVILILLSTFSNSSTYKSIAGVFACVALIFFIFSAVRYYKAEKTKAKRIFPFVYLAVDTFSVTVWILLIPMMLDSGVAIFFAVNILSSLMTAYLMLKMKYAKEKRVLDRSVAHYVVKKIRESLR